MLCGVVRCHGGAQVEEVPTPEVYAKMAAAAAAATPASLASLNLRVTPRDELVPVALYVPLASSAALPSPLSLACTTWGCVLVIRSRGALTCV